MASSSKRQTTREKMAREQAVRERRARKQQKKDDRKQALAMGVVAPESTLSDESVDEPTGELVLPAGPVGVGGPLSETAP